MLIRTILLIFLVSLLVACDMVSGLPIGKPSTSAPRANDPTEHYALCAERRDAIADWEREQTRKITEKLADEKITWLRAGIDYEKIEDETHEMRLDLQDNCNDAFNEKWGPR